FCLGGGLVIDDPPSAPSQKLSDGTKTRSEFERLSPHDRLAFMKNGGQLIDGDPPSAPSQKLSDGTKTRDVFEKLSKRDRLAFMNNGGRLVDGRKNENQRPTSSIRKRSHR